MSMSAIGLLSASYYLRCSTGYYRHPVPILLLSLPMGTIDGVVWCQGSSTLGQALARWDRSWCVSSPKDVGRFHSTISQGH